MEKIIFHLQCQALTTSFGFKCLSGLKRKGIYNHSDTPGLLGCSSNAGPAPWLRGQQSHGAVPT